MNTTEKKLLIVIPLYSSYKIFLEESVNKFVENGWEVLITCDCKSQNINEDKVKIFNISLPRGLNILTYFRKRKIIKELVKEFKPTIIHVHFSAAAFLMALSISNSWPKMIATIQGVIFTSTGGLYSKLIKQAEIYAYKKFYKLYVLTEDDYQALAMKTINVVKQKSFGFGFSKANYIESDSNEKKNLKRSLGISDGDNVMIYVGRLVKFKGIDITFRSFLKASNTISNLKWIICGDFDPLHPSGLSQSELRILSSHPNIKWVGYTNDVYKYLQISDVNVFPSQREGMPVNLMESLSVGVPVITFNTRGCKDVVSNLIDGFVIDVCYDISSTIIDYFSDYGRILRFKQNALNKKKQFEREHFTNECLEIYNELLLNT